MKKTITTVLLLSTIFFNKVNGQTWSAVGPGLSSIGGGVSALEVFNNQLYVAGAFDSAGPVHAINLGKWDGSAWNVAGSLNLASGTLYTLGIHSSNLYCGGTDFGVTGPCQDIAVLNGGTWSAVGTGIPIVEFVYCMASYGGNLYVGGDFTLAGGNSANCIAKWDGTSWTALGSGANGAVLSMKVYGGELYIGGLFTSIGGVAANRIAKWNGTSFSSLSATGGVSEIDAFAIFGSDLYVGGSFSSIGAAANCNGVAKWNGSAFSSLGSGVLMGGIGNIRALATYDNALYAGGTFAGSSYNGIAKWNGSSWSSLGSGINGGVYALCAYNGSLYAGGVFTTAGTVTSRLIARWTTSTGIEENEMDKNINTYPNPTTSETTITFSEAQKSTSIKVMNTLGECIQQLTTNNQQLTLDMSGYAKGIYFVRIENEKGIVNRKIIVQ